VSRLDRSNASPHRLVISATTNTGIDRALALYGDRHPVVRFPFDFSWMVWRFLDTVQPQTIALMELEVWPNLVQEARLRGIPLVVINGRLSDSSFGSYRWARRWLKPMFQGLTAVAAQTEEYAQRFRELGTPSEGVTVTDTMKWDTVALVDEVEGARELAEAMGIDSDRPLVVAGSTGPGEEELLIGERPPGVQLLLVPRKPERFDEVARLAPGIVRRSLRLDGGFPRGVSGTRSAPPDLFLLDTMGELTKAYSLADVAIVGRSFVPLGGSDPIEPVALGKPTLVGPRHENFRDVVAALEEGGGLRVVDRPMEVAQELLADPDEGRAMAVRGREVIRRRQGATDQNAEILFRVLASEGAPTPLPRRPVRKWVLRLLAGYMALGYLTTAFHRVDTEGPVDPATPLPALDGSLASGVFSVHTGRSHDAKGTREQVAVAAASAGLDFVVIGDHPPDDRKPGWEFWDPVFMEGVFIEGGQELRSPEAGKVLAIGVDTTYLEWEGAYSSFADLLLREGATSMVVHGRGPRQSERWVNPTTQGVQGWEVLDISETSRQRLRGPWSVYHLLTLMTGTPFGLGDEALRHMMREGFDTPAVAAYDSLRMESNLTATAGLNVHPKVGVGPFLLPSYGPFFRTLVSHLALPGPLSADPFAAQNNITEAISSGDMFVSVGRAQAARGFRVGVIQEGVGVLPMGGDAPHREGMSLRAGFAESPGRKVVYRIMRNGLEEGWIRGPELEWPIHRPGFYRVEVYTYGARLGKTFLRLRPWIFANTIGLRGAGEAEG